MALSRITQATAASSAVTFSAPTSGDLILVFAHRDGSTTPPTVPGTYTTIANPTGANTNAACIGYRVSDGTETTTGTWTNATSIAVIVYRGQHATDPIGAFAAGGASSLILSYTTVPLHAAGLSWVAGFAAHRSADTDIATNGQPTGMTLESGVTDICACDTEGAVSAWATTTKTLTTGTSSGWRTYTVEVIPATADPHFKQSAVSQNATATNPTQAITGITAGNTLVGEVSWGSITVNLTSITSTLGNTVTLLDNPTTGGVSRAANFWCHIVTGGNETLTVNFDATATSAIAVHEIVGADATTPVDKHTITSQNNPPTTTDGIASAAVTPAVNGEYIYGSNCDFSNSTVDTAGTGFTKQGGVAGATGDSNAEYLIQTTAASITATFTTANTFKQTLTSIITVQPAVAATVILPGLGSELLTGRTNSLGFGIGMPDVP